MTEILALPDGLTARCVTVTPALAASWLEHHNDRNRRMSPMHMHKLSGDMARGAWRFLGDPVRFVADPFADDDTERKAALLIDGQHRLEAIVASQKSVPLLVVAGFTPDAQRFVDGGRVRSAADQITIESMKSATVLAAAARLLLLWRDGSLGGSSIAKAAVSTSRVTEWVLEHPHLALSAPFGYACSARLAGGPTVYAAFHFALRELDPYLADHFMTTLESGADIGRGHPVFTIRRTLEKATVLGRSETPVRVLYRLIRAWDAWVEGRTVHAIPVPSRLGPGHLPPPKRPTPGVVLAGLPSQLALDSTVAAG